MSNDEPSLATGAELLEQIADGLERLMPSVRRARAALTDSAPVAARVVEFDGSHEYLEMDAADGYGFNRMEAARRCILEALRKPLDELEF